MVIFCALVNFVFCLVLAKTGTDASLPDYATLCPYNDFCTSSAKKWIAPTSGTETCCARCSCALDCHLVGNCCPDMPNITANEPEYRCVEMNEILNYPRNVYGSNGVQKYFHVINRCPNADLSRQYPACENPQTLEDYKFASNMDNEKVYRNKHCAICHGLENFIEWELGTSCVEMMKETFQTFEERDEFVLENCWLDPIPPNRDIVELAKCHGSSVISGCRQSNDLNNWVYDPIDLKQACYKQRPGQNTVYQDADSKDVYSSVYCYLCNNPTRRNGSGRCPIPPSPGGVIEGVFESFYAVIRNLVKVPETDDSCKSMEKWDSVTKTCRMLHCPIGTTPFHGSCEPIVDFQEGLVHSVTFEVKVVHGNPPFTMNLLHNLIAHVWKFWTDTFCSTCGGILTRKNSSVFFEKLFMTNKWCNMSTIRANARHMTVSVSNTTIGNGHGKVGYEVKLIHSNIKEIIETDEDIISMPRCSKASINIDTQFLYDCPRFVMPVTEMIAIRSGGLPAYGHTQGLVSICVDKYSKVLGRQ